MTLLNRASNGHVPSMVALWRTARVFGPMPRVDLEALCRPRINPGEKILSMTFSTWRALGMFAEGNNGVAQLSPPFDVLEDTDTDGLRTAVLAQLLKPENSPALLDVDAASREDNTRASDFVRVASWALAQDPYRLASANEGAALEQARAQGIELFRGAGRWTSFLEWAYFVGLGVFTKYGFVLNPACAIREILARDKDRLKVGEEHSLTAFFDELAKELPVVDRGSYREQIDDILRQSGYAFDAHQVSPSLSLALLQLHHEEEIELSDRAGDIAVRFSLVGRGKHVVRTASHIRRGNPRHNRSANSTATSVRS